MTKDFAARKKGKIEIHLCERACAGRAESSGKRRVNKPDLSVRPTKSNVVEFAALHKPMAPAASSNGVSPKGNTSIKMPGDDSRQRDEQKNTKLIRFLTVIAYMCCVSLAAVMLSLYYVFIWDPKPAQTSAFKSPPQYYPYPIANGSETWLTRHGYFSDAFALEKSFNKSLANNTKF